MVPAGLDVPVIPGTPGSPLGIFGRLIEGDMAGILVKPAAWVGNIFPTDSCMDPLAMLTGSMEAVMFSVIRSSSSFLAFWRGWRGKSE